VRASAAARDRGPVRPAGHQQRSDLAAVPTILEQGEHYRDFGTGRSRALPFQLASNIRRGGRFELPRPQALRGRGRDSAAARPAAGR
jgi:NADH:ubiquinone oxidoreductase subunit F (NADH-binding)